MVQYVQLALEDLPDATQPEMDFHDSSWFQAPSQTQAFPSPEEIKSRSIKAAPNAAKFEELNLAVKFRSATSASEAVCLWAIRKYLGNEVPVPEVYGWRIFGRQVFIYMQLVHGPTLEEIWDTLNHYDRKAVCNDLRDIMYRLRTLRPSGLEQQIVGSISHGPPLDRTIDCQPTIRPFPTISAFHDWISLLWRRPALDPTAVPDPWRQLLPDSGPVVFTHADFHRSNIIVTSTSPPRVAAIVDWEQAGWYPEYWEYCKAKYTVLDSEDWVREGWLDSILQPYPDAWEAFQFYITAIGSC